MYNVEQKQLLTRVHPRLQDYFLEEDKPSNNFGKITLILKAIFSFGTYFIYLAVKKAYHNLQTRKIRDLLDKPQSNADILSSSL
ncbi:MAG: hypothetical protein WC371_05750 [Parachlamydiales bacterium]|jgi:hypothetical protein